MTGVLGAGFGVQRLGFGVASLGSAALMASTAGMGFTPLGLASTGMIAINGVSLKSMGLTALAGTAYTGHWLYNGGIGQWIGNTIGNTFEAGIEGIDLGELTKAAVNSFSEAISEGIKGFDSKTIADSISNNIEDGMKGMNFQKLVDTWYTEYGEVAIKLFDKITTETSTVATNVLKNNAETIVTRVVPLLALGSAVILGTPLAVYYFYKRVSHNIGKPKLAQEIKNNNPFDRAYELALNTLGVVYDSTKTYYKWLYGSTVTAYGLSALAGMAYTAKGLYFEEFYQGGWATDFLNDAFCEFGNLIIDSSFQCNKSVDEFLSYEAVSTAITAIAFAAIFYKNGKGFYKYIKSHWGVTKSKPIFNDSIKETVDDVIDATKNLQQNGGYFQNMILYGPGGTGKTMISKYIARNSGMNYIMMSGGDLAQYIKRGEHVTELVKIFNTANNSAGPTILFIDEAESLCRDRSKMNRDELFELLNSFLNQTGEPSEKIMLVLATNRLEDIDEAVLSRMDNKVFVGPPEFEQRKRILAMYATHFFTKSERREFFNEEALAELSLKTEGLTGRALFKMLNVLSTKQKCSSSNSLTIKLVNLVVDRFVKQEAEVKEAREVNKATATAVA